ncbi:MAG: cell division protein ZipA C-terminal FtsZ-binding domain-containing protein [Sterolibacterium sp.]|nr:cell division protein ZipA C-terminal FtsZ-binding domain-containing protein [Sterolibacterium sp.]
MAHGISELQLSLIVIGVLSVAAVWGYNLWQERKHRQLAQKVFRGEQRDVLMQAAPAEESTAAVPVSPFAVPAASPILHERIEPRFTPLVDDAVVDVVDVADVASVPAGTAEETAAAAAAPDDNETTANAPTASQSGLMDGNIDEDSVADQPPEEVTAEDSDLSEELADPLIDCVVHLDAAELIAAPLFWAAQRQILNRLVNRVVWSGFEENSGCWQRLHANDASSYRHLVAALQLADRNGPAAADDLALYCDGVRQLAVHYHAQVLVPVVADVLTRARTLDDFCASVDWRLSLNLVHAEGQALAVDEIRRLADIAGLRPCDKTQKMDGLLHGLNAQGMTAFTLGLLDGQGFDAASTMASSSTAGAVLTIDVPRVSDGPAAFDRMTQVAELINHRLGTVLVDDQRRALSVETLAMIRAKIAEFQQKMIAQQIPPGSRRALRLYA